MHNHFLNWESLSKTAAGTKQKRRPQNHSQGSLAFDVVVTRLIYGPYDLLPTVTTTINIIIIIHHFTGSRVQATILYILFVVSTLLDSVNCQLEPLSISLYSSFISFHFLFSSPSHFGYRFSFLFYHLFNLHSLVTVAAAASPWFD